LFAKFYANILESKGQKKEACSILDEYLNRYKKDINAWKYSASLHNELGNQDKVMQLMDSAAYYFPADKDIPKLKDSYTFNYYVPD
jgi:predicted Zn-dependent protease